jgi:hypothetical protein
VLGVVAVVVVAALSALEMRNDVSLEQRNLAGAWQYALIAVPLGGFFGFRWPSWSWRWGLLIAWPLILTALATVALPLVCQPGSPCLEDAPDQRTALVFAALIPIPCAAAAAGAFVRSLRDRRAPR